MALQAIAYSSQCMPGLTPVQIEMLVRDADTYNALAGVTGVLLFDGSRFLQYIEGPEDGMASVYGRIFNATSHMEIMELGRGRPSARRFPYWSMRLITVEAMDLRAAALSDWTRFSVPSAGNRRLVSGIERLTQLVQPHLA